MFSSSSAGRGVEWAGLDLMICQVTVMTGERDKCAEGGRINDLTMVFKL